MIAPIDPGMIALVDGDAPVPTTEVLGVGMEAYATIAVRLGARGAVRAEVLGAAGLDEASWVVVEATWLVRIAAAARRGDGALLGAFDAATVRAQDAVAAAPTPEIDAWADLVAAIEAGEDPARAITAAGLDLPSFARAQRDHAARAAGDPAAFTALRAKVEARIAARRR